MKEENRTGCQSRLIGGPLLRLILVSLLIRL